MRQRTFFLTSFGWRTYFVGQIHMSKAQKHIVSAYKCVWKLTESALYQLRCKLPTQIVVHLVCVVSHGCQWSGLSRGLGSIFGDPNKRQRTFFLTSFGCGTLSVGPLQMCKAQKHTESAHKCPLRPPGDLFGHETDKTCLETQT